jgi:hypothetical protein
VVQLVQVRITSHAALLSPSPPLVRFDVEHLTHTNREAGIRFPTMLWSFLG